jgi:hypothetical protein
VSKLNGFEKRVLDHNIEVEVSRYEKDSGLQAIHFRQLRKNASLKAKYAAIGQDLRWCELHAQEVAGALQRAQRAFP